MNAVPGWFKVVAVLALLWNVLGRVAFFADLRLSPAEVAQLPDAQQALYAARPAWAVVRQPAPSRAGSVARGPWALRQPYDR